LDKKTNAINFPPAGQPEIREELKLEKHADAALEFSTICTLAHRPLWSL